jgi:predicted amidophosphoribosyltransferase
MNNENVTYCPRCEDAVPQTSQICDHCGYELKDHSETETVGREMMRLRLEENYTISPATRNVALSLLIVVLSGISIAACNL